MSGTSASRPESKWLLTQLRIGDSVHNYKLDRLGRSLRHLLKQLGVHEIAQRLHTPNVTLYKYLTPPQSGHSRPPQIRPEQLGRLTRMIVMPFSER